MYRNERPNCEEDERCIPAGNVPWERWQRNNTWCIHFPSQLGCCLKCHPLGYKSILCFLQEFLWDEEILTWTMCRRPPRLFELVIVLALFHCLLLCSCFQHGAPGYFCSGEKKKKKKIQLGRRSNWWCRLFPKHWCDRCSHDLLFVNTDPDVGPACSEIFASCCSASIRFHLVVHCHSSCSAVLLHRMKEEVSGASKARTTSRWSQSSGSKSTPPIRLYLSMWNQSSTVLCIGHVPAQRHSSPSKANSRNRCVGILGVNPLRILLNCSTVRQEWWVNTRWCPTLILVSVPLVFLGQGEMNSKDSYEACSKLSTAGFAVKWRRIGGQHKILLKKDMKNGHCWTYSFPAIIFNLTLAWLLWRWTGKRAL